MKCEVQIVATIGNGRKVLLNGQEIPGVMAYRIERDAKDHFDIFTLVLHPESIKVTPKE